MVTKVLLDSNILMDLMNEIEAAANEVEYYDDVAISAVTWIEVATGLDAAACLNFETNMRTSKIKVIHTDDAIVLASRRPPIRRRPSARPGTPRPKATLGGPPLRSTSTPRRIQIFLRDCHSSPQLTV